MIVDFNERILEINLQRFPQPYSTHPATVVLLQQRLTPFRRYQYPTPPVLTQDLPSLLLTS